MHEIVTLVLPKQISKILERTCKATKQSIEKILLNALQNSLPSLDGLPEDFIENLTSRENLTDDELKQILNEKVSENTQTKISELLQKNRDNPLTTSENNLLESLQKEADLVMLRKARTADLLRFRGQRIPTLAELEQTQRAVIFQTI